MKNYSQIYHALWTWLSQGGEWKHKGHLTTCIGIMMALLETGSVHLTQWIPYIPCRGVYAGGQQRRLQRWLHNSRINNTPLVSAPDYLGFSSMERKEHLLEPRYFSILGRLLLSSPSRSASWSSYPCGMASYEA